MLRIGDARVVHQIFNRTSLSKKATAFVDSLIEKYLGCLEQSVAGIRSGSGFLMDNLRKYWRKSFRRYYPDCVANALHNQETGFSTFFLAFTSRTIEVSMGKSAT